MKKTFYFKTLLLMIAFITGGINAWGDTYDIQTIACDFENSETLFTFTGRGSLTNADDPAGGSNKVLNMTSADNAGNVAPGALAIYNFKDKAEFAEKLDISFDCYLTQISGQMAVSVGDGDKRSTALFNTKGSWGAKDEGSIFQFRTERGKLDGKSNENYCSVSGNKYGSTTTLKANNFLGFWVTVTLNVDVKNKKISYTLKKKGETESIVSATDVDFYNAQALACTQIDLQTGVNSTSMYIDNVNIKTYTPQLTPVSYTVNFLNKSDNSVVKPAETRSGVVGVAADASAADKTTFYNTKETTKYVYDSNTTMVLGETAEKNIINVYYNVYDKTSYTVKAKNAAASLDSVIVSSEAFFDGSTTAFWSRYVLNKKDGKWYETVAPYGKAVDGNIEVNYVPSSIVYFIEGEKMYDYRAAATANGTAYSNGVTGRHYTNSSWYTDVIEAGGKYLLTFPYTHHTSTSSSTITISSRATDGTLTLIEELVMSADGVYSKEINIPSGTSLAISNPNSWNSNYLIDYLTLSVPYTYSVKAVDEVGKELKGILTGSCMKGDTISVGFPRYILKDNVLYGTTANSSDPLYIKKIVPNKDGFVENIVYKPADLGDVQGVAFFAEAEDIDGISSISSRNNLKITEKASQGKCGYLHNTDATITTLPAGSYQLVANVQNKGDWTYKFTAGTDTIKFAVGNNDATQGKEYKVDFSLTAKKDIVWLGAVKNSADITNVNAQLHTVDYLYVVKTAESLDDIVEDYNNAKDEAVYLDGKMSKEAQDALDAAVEAAANLTTIAGADSARAMIQDALEQAKASIAAYEHADSVLQVMVAVADTTNFYDETLGEAFLEELENDAQGYADGSLSDDDARALNLEKTKALLLSAWENDSTLSVNTEGDVPFVEAAVDTLAHTLKATLKNKELGQYTVKAVVDLVAPAAARGAAAAAAPAVTIQLADGKKDTLSVGNNEVTLKGNVRKADEGKLSVILEVPAKSGIEKVQVKSLLLSDEVGEADIEDLMVIEPAAGKLDSLQTVTITFGGKAVELNPGAVPVLDGEVNGTIAQNDAQDTVTVSFPEVVKEPGEHIVYIPENTIYYKGVAIESQTLIYTIDSLKAEEPDTLANLAWTYVDYNQPAVAMGSFAVTDTIRSGYNKISGGAVGFGNTGWGENKIAFIYADASKFTEKIVEATLTIDVSGSTDSKRTTGWGVGYNDSEWAADTLTYNNADRSITLVGAQQWTSTKSATTFETKSFDVTEVLTNDEDHKVTFIIYETAAAGGYITNAQLVIKTANEDEITNYAVNFLSEAGDTLKATALHKGILIGSKVAATAEEIASFKNEDASKKFIYKEGNDSITLVADAAQNKIDLIFREAAKYLYTVRAVTDENTTIVQLAKDSAFEQETVTAPYVKYGIANDRLWTKAAVNNQYNYSFEVTKDKQIVRLVYDAVVDEEGNDVKPVFYAEAENIEGMTKTTASNANIRCSYSAGGFSTDSVYVTTLSAGTYTIESQVWGNAGTTLTIFYGDEKLDMETAGYIKSYKTDAFTLDKATDIYAKGGAEGKCIDYILITGEGSVVTDGISEAAGTRILNNNQIYNLQGQKVDGTRKGLYIINGRKVVVK